MVRPSDQADPLLRRPLSIHDCRGDILSLLIRSAGRGTARLTKLGPDDSLDLFGPLGRGFPDPTGPALIIGGGIGIAPLLFLARSRSVQSTAVRLGAPTADQLLAVTDFQALGLEPGLFTDDGSAGTKGLVTTGLEDELARTKATVLACGPEPMLRAVAGAADRAGAAAYLSLEARMACGVGACLGCVVEAADGSRPRVCADGPVFEAGRIYGSGGGHER